MAYTIQTTALGFNLLNPDGSVYYTQNFDPTYPNAKVSFFLPSDTPATSAAKIQAAATAQLNAITAAQSSATPS
jgi:hypothetical protein